MGLGKETEMQGAGTWDPESSCWFGHQMLDGIDGGNMEVQGRRCHPQKQNCSLIRTAEGLHFAVQMRLCLCGMGVLGA